MPTHHSTFPKSWKSATKIPLLKQSNSLNVSNLRPITLLPILGKLLEKVACTRLQTYLDVHYILTPHQHGYQKGHSTQSAINEHITTIIDNIIADKPTISLYPIVTEQQLSPSHLIELIKSKCNLRFLYISIP